MYTAICKFVTTFAAFPVYVVEKLGLGAVREKPQEEGAGIMRPVAPRIFLPKKS